jgi:hypothetical protein
MNKWNAAVVFAIDAFRLLKDEERRIEERLAINDKLECREKLSARLNDLQTQASIKNEEVLELLRNFPGDRRAMSSGKRYH